MTKTKERPNKIFNVEQMCRHSETDEVLITEEQIKDILNYKGIKPYEYIFHDKNAHCSERIKIFISKGGTE